jgi:hypothetical protein
MNNRFGPDSDRSLSGKNSAGFDPFEAFMNALPGEPLARKADDHILCDRAATIRTGKVAR